MSKLFSASVSYCQARTCPTLTHSSQSAPDLLRAQTRFGTWRKLWLSLALAEKQLGLNIPDKAIEEMKANLVRVRCRILLAAARLPECRNLD